MNTKPLFILVLAYLVVSLYNMSFAQITAQGGYCLKFDGANDYVTTGANLVNLANDMTVEAWFKTTNSTGYNSIVTIDKTASGTNDYLQILTNSSGKVYLDDANDATIFTTTESYNDGKWHHVAFVRNASIKTIYLYVDGVLKLSQEYTYSGSIDPDHELRFGNSKYEGGSYQMDGMIDEVRIWSDVRTEAEIKANMYKELQGNEAGLEGYYNMNGSAGTSLTDNSGNNNTGTLVNGPTWEISGCFGGSRQALDFDGSNDYVNFTTDPVYNNNTVTIEAWIQSTHSGNEKVIVSWGSNPVLNDNVQLRMQAGKLQFGMDVLGWESVIGDNNINTGAWTHVAAVKNASNIYLYVNGKLDTQGSINKIPNVPQFFISAYYKNGTLHGCYFPGKIDEVRIWNTVRTESQIQENMMKTLAGNETGLVAYYRMDQYDGTTLYDMTSNGNNGTLTNMDAADWVASSAFNTWIGTENTTWTNANNWTNGAPASGQSLGFYNSTNGVDFSLNSTLSYGSMYLSNVNTITFGSSSELSFSGSLINQGEITLKSDATGDASLLIDGSLSGSGTYNVERYLSGNQWHLVSSPITAGTSGVFEDIWLRPYNEAENEFGDYITPTTTPLPTGQGFSVWADANETRTFTGTINHGVIGPLGAQLTGAAGPDAGWNLMGNPYPSAIDWSAASGWTKNDLADAVYVWNNNQYATYIGDVGNNGGSRYIASGQGFFVQATASGASLSMDNDVRVHNGVSFMKSTKSDPENTIRVTVSADGYEDENVIVIRDANANAFDPQADAYKLQGSADAPQMHIEKDDFSRLAIASFPQMHDIDDKTLHVDYAQEGTHSLSWSHNCTAENTPGLLDQQTGDIIEAGSNYTFTAAHTDMEDRFVFTADLTSLEENINALAVWEYNNTVFVNSNDNRENQISVYSLQGVEVYSNTGNQFDLNHLAPAMYLVKVKSGNKVKNEKIVIK